MVKRIKIRTKKVLSVVLIISMLGSLVAGCAKQEAKSCITETEAGTEKVSEVVDVKKIAETVAESIIQEEKTSIQIDNTNGSKPEPIMISTDWNDYVGDFDTLVYGFLKNEFSLYYDVFNAVVTDENGNCIYGLGYTDYSACLEDEEGGTYFPAGFVSFIGEPGTRDLNKEGVQIYNLDYDDDSKFHFLYAYNCDPFLEHCVVWNHYLQYGVNADGCITYNVQEYKKDNCDESLGALYSYDENKYLYDPNVGEFVYLSGESLSEQIDFDALEDEVNRILDNQDKEFAQVDIETAAYIAQEAVISSLLSFQQETYLGCDVSELIEYARELDPKECIKFNENGIVLINLDEQPPSDAELLTKWLVGTGCALTVIGCIVIDIFAPYLAPVAGSISGTAFEVFMEVIFDNQDLENINLKKIAVAAITGAVMAWVCPQLAGAATNGTVQVLGKSLTLSVSEDTIEMLSKLAGYSVLTVSNSVAAGSASAAMTVIDGGDKEAVQDAFRWGAAIGAACTLILGCLLPEHINYRTQLLESKNPENWFLKLSEKGSVYIGDHQLHLNNETLEDILVPKSVYEASNAAMKELRIERCGGDSVLADKISQLPSDNNKNFVKVNDKGEVLTKADLCSNGGNCTIKPTEECDPEILKTFTEHNITEIKVLNGDPQFAPASSFSFKPSGGITSNRDLNLDNYCKDMAKDWSVNQEKIPDDIKTALIKKGVSLDDLTSAQVREVLSNTMYTMHEGTDGVVYLVKRVLHNSFSHYGGVALAKAMAMLEVGAKNIKELYSSSASAITGTLIAEGVSRNEQ